MSAVVRYSSRRRRCSSRVAWNRRGSGCGASFFFGRTGPNRPLSRRGALSSITAAVAAADAGVVPTAVTLKPWDVACSHLVEAHLSLLLGYVDDCANGAEWKQLATVPEIVHTGAAESLVAYLGIFPG